MNFEQRTYVKAELRAEPDFVISGKAVTYNKPSPDNQLAPGVREMVASGAFSDSIKAGGFQGDVIATQNHDDNHVLGRLSNRTLQLFDSADALRFRVQLDKTNPVHQAARAAAMRGDLSQCSFSFSDTQDEFVPDTDSTGAACVTRIIRRASLLDVSIVARPFYSLPGSTAVAARAAEVRSKNGIPTPARAAKNSAEAIKQFRKATQLMARSDYGKQALGEEGYGRQGDPNGVNPITENAALVRANMQAAHEWCESAYATLCTARDIMDSDVWAVSCPDSPDYDPDDTHYDESLDYSRSKRSGDYSASQALPGYEGWRSAFDAMHQAVNECCQSFASVRLDYERIFGKPFVPKG